MFMGWCFDSHLVLRCTTRHQNKPILVVYVYGVVLLLAFCTSAYKQAPTQAYLTSLGFSCLCLWDGAFNRNLYFPVQTGTKTTLILVVYVYEVMLFTSIYKQAPKQTYF